MNKKAFVTCVICKHFNIHEGGTCKRHPPQMIRESFFVWKYGHPKTYENDYCGDGEIDEKWEKNEKP